jgi:hypothetical protein
MVNPISNHSITWLAMKALPSTRVRMIRRRAIGRRLPCSRRLAAACMVKLEATRIRVNRPSRRSGSSTPGGGQIGLDARMVK